MQPVGPAVPESAEPSAVVRDRISVITSLLLLVLAAVAWVSVVRSGLRDPDMMMTMAMPLALADAVAFTLSWTVMMAAMMLPSALPMIVLYGAIQRGAVGPGTKGVSVAMFTLVYLVVWGATGAPVYVAHTLLMMLADQAFAYGVGAVLLAAGVFQLSPLKQACLRACRSPLGFLLGHWRAGLTGSVRLGWAHAVYCLGCCWALMLVLVAAGAMGLAWVLLVAAAVAAEKLMPRGEWIARAGGAALVLLGLAVVVHPDLVTALRGGHAM